MIAVKNQYIELVEILCNNGADVNKEEWHGTALTYARESKNKEIMKMLKKFGAHDDVVDSDDEY